MHVVTATTSASFLRCSKLFGRSIMARRWWWWHSGAPPRQWGQSGRVRPADLKRWGGEQRGGGERPWANMIGGGRREEQAWAWCNRGGGGEEKGQGEGRSGLGPDPGGGGGEEGLGLRPTRRRTGGGAGPGLTRGWERWGVGLNPTWQGKCGEERAGDCQTQGSILTCPSFLMSNLLVHQ